ncbi:MAG: methyltransferase domain-containing protein [Xanthobacteraceae bacterium]
MRAVMSILPIYLLAVLVAAHPVDAQTTVPTQHQHMGDRHPGGSSDRDIHHSFGQAEMWAKEFDDPSRDAWQKPDEVLDALNLPRTARVADIGAGTGYFSVRIARRVPDGKVFAADVEPNMVRYIAERAHREHLRGIVPVQASAESPNLPEPVDVALVVDTYHHIGNRVAYFAKLRDSLRPNGRLAIVDFKADAPIGPPPAMRISHEKVVEELTAAGYSLVATHLFLPWQFFLVFQKNAS